MNDELKPCPFCGWKKPEIIGQDGIAWSQCPDCACEGPTTETVGEAIKAWNQRAGAQS